MSNQVLNNLKLLEEIKSKFANIRIYETEENKIILTLNTFIQLISGEDEEIYHDMLTMSAINSCPEAKNALILGGADGCCARDIIEKNPKVKITLVDIDKEVIKLFKTNKRLSKLNKNSLEKCNIIIDDAKKWIKTCKDKFDIIICDFPDANNKELEELYSEKFYSEVIKLLEIHGMISIQVNRLISKEISKKIEKILGNVYILDYKMPFLGEGSIISGIKY